MKVKALVTAIVTLLLFLSVSPQAAWAERKDQGPDFTQIDRYVQAEMGRAPIPGLSYAVVQRDQVLHIQVFGAADPSGRPVTAQTPFVIGSIGKSFTALAITQLVAAGKLDLDAPVQRYISWFRTADSLDDSTDPAGQITLRHLLAHTSGLSNADGNKTIFFDERSNLETLVRRIETVHLNRPVGSTHEYSNLNYLVLGLVVQIVAGQPYEAYIQQNIFEPLDMRHTYFSEEPAVQDGLAAGYHILFGVPVPIHARFPTGAAAQGYVISSIEDMTHYMMAYVNYGTYRDRSLTGQSAPKDNQFWYDIYWQPRNDRGNVGEGCSGGTANFNSYIYEAFSEQDRNFGIVVLMNTRPELLVDTVSAETITDGIRGMLYGNPASSPTGLARYTWYGGFLLIDLALLGLMAYTATAGWMLSRWLKSSSKRIKRPVFITLRMPLLNLLLGLLSFLLPPILIGYNWPMLWLCYSEICMLILPIAIILSLAGLVQLIAPIWLRPKQAA